jgi:pimeloyl-ACP methyl ester carboxylesterase
VATPFGATHINTCGPREAPPVVLLPGGGTSSVVWFGAAAALADTHRVYAPDLVGEPGRSVPEGPPIRSGDDLAAWLDAVLDGLGLDSTALYGHSYEAWIAVRYALRAPSRPRRLVLLDPPACFTGFSKSYLLRALPMLLRSSPRTKRSFLDWETRGGHRPDADVLRLFDLAAEFPTVRPVVIRPLDPAALRTITVPTLLLLVGRSRAHDITRVAEAARRTLPDVRTEILPDVGHHALPAGPLGTDDLVAGFLED